MKLSEQLIIVDVISDMSRGDISDWVIRNARVAGEFLAEFGPPLKTFQFGERVCVDESTAVVLDQNPDDGVLCAWADGETSWVDVESVESLDD